MANAMLAVNFVSNKFGRERLEFNGFQYMVHISFFSLSIKIISFSKLNYIYFKVRIFLIS